MATAAIIESAPTAIPITPTIEAVSRATDAQICAPEAATGFIVKSKSRYFGVKNGDGSPFTGWSLTTKVLASPREADATTLTLEEAFGLKAMICDSCTYRPTYWPSEVSIIEVETGEELEGFEEWRAQQAQKRTELLAKRASQTLAEVEESAILAAYQKTETHGLEFGRLCYEYKEKYGAQGSRTGKGLAQLLRKLGIKEGKAYYWINEYEILIGVRQPKADDEPKPNETGWTHEPSETGGSHEIDAPEINTQAPESQTHAPQTQVKPPLLQQAVINLKGERIKLSGVIYTMKAEPQVKELQGVLCLVVPVEIAEVA